MTNRTRIWTVAAASVLAIAAVPVVAIQLPGVANADVCASAGRRVQVSGCANLADVMAPYVPPPAYSAPIPEDCSGPPPPPPPLVAVCVGATGRRGHVSVGGCT